VAVTESCIFTILFASYLGREDIMKVHELLTLPKLAYKNGFKLKKGRIVWSDVHVNGDRKRIRISKFDRIRYIKPHTEVEVIP